MSRAGDLTWPAAADRSTWVLAVPLGSTEQHGPHLPLST
ncbi:MAG: creatininase family protein, partial [Mycobacteriales bacterium]